MKEKLPNMLTILRIFMVPLFPIAFFYSNYWALAVFIIAGISDILDGYLARKFNVISKFGIAMDPLADKLMLIAVMITFGVKKLLPLWIIIFLIVKELIMIVIGLYFYFKKEKYAIPSNIYGKSATMLLFLTILGMLLFPEINYFIYFIYLAIVIKITALFTYVIHYLKEKKLEI